MQHDETQVPLLPDSRVCMLNAGDELIALLSFVDAERSVDAGAVSDIGCDAGGVDSEIWVGLFALLYLSPGAASVTWYRSKYPGSIVPLCVTPASVIVSNRGSVGLQ